MIFAAYSQREKEFPRLHTVPPIGFTSHALIYLRSSLSKPIILFPAIATMHFLSIKKTHLPLLDLLYSAHH